MDDDAFYKSIAGAVPPSLNDERRRMADAGDFEGLIRAFGEAMPVSWELESFFSLLQKAVKVAANADRIGFAQRTFEGMVGFTAYLGYRSQLTAQQILTQIDQSCGYRLDDRWLRPGPLRETLEYLREIQSHLANILHAEACTARVWSLARQRPESVPTTGNPPSSKRGTTTKTRPTSSARRRQATKTVRRPVFVARNGTTKSPKAGNAS